MKCSIVTVCYNALGTLPTTIRSFQSQQYKNKEHIIVDGASSDGTSSYLRDNQIEGTWVSEPDRGIYDAMNKGVRMSSGDVIGILNADDAYYDSNVLDTVMSVFDRYDKLDAVYGDVVFEKQGKVWRNYSAKNWSPTRLAWGFMPPHPGVFLRKSLFHTYGLYKTDYEIAADYELIIRLFWKHGIEAHYHPMITTRMALGGVSTRNMGSNILLNKEILRGCRENGLKTNYFKIYSKYFVKWKELL